MTGHRLHACDAGEIRWLRALAARAGVGAGTGGPEGAAPAPNARAPEDIARIATVAEGLHGEIRVIANRLIAGWVAEVQAYRESRNA